MWLTAGQESTRHRTSNDCQKGVQSGKGRVATDVTFTPQPIFAKKLQLKARLPKDLHAGLTPRLGSILFSPNNRASRVSKAVVFLSLLGDSGRRRVTIVTKAGLTSSAASGKVGALVETDKTAGG